MNMNRKEVENFLIHSIGRQENLSISNIQPLITNSPDIWTMFKDIEDAGPVGKYRIGFFGDIMPNERDLVSVATAMDNSGTGGLSLYTNWRTVKMCEIGTTAVRIGQSVHADQLFTHLSWNPANQVQTLQQYKYSYLGHQYKSLFTFCGYYFNIAQG